MENNTSRVPSPLLSLVPVLVLVSLLFVTIRIFGSDALSGGSQVVLLLSSAVCSCIAIVHSKIKWKEIEKAIIGNVAGVTPAILILLIIGALSGAWMISGVVPTLIYYGMKIIHPSFYLVSTCVICAIVAVVTGSSWTTIATIGIALLGVGQALGFSEGWIAGALISGSYFGDTMSPLSDTTILASSVTETPLFTHIRYLWITTVPSMLITLVIFTVAGFSAETASTEQITTYSEYLRKTFTISIWLLIVPVLTLFLIIKRISAIITLFTSALLAGLIAVIVQSHLLNEIAGAVIEGWAAKFKGLFITFYGSTNIETGNEGLNELVTTSGMAGMMNTVWLIICAMIFGGTMMASGMLKSVMSVFVRFMKRALSMVASTVASGLFLNVATADQYISIILTGNMFKDVYKENGYESRLLGRTIEDAVTVTSPLIPWNTCGMTQSMILGVSTFTYLPYSFFNWISPIMSILVAATGYKIFKRKENPEVKP